MLKRSITGLLLVSFMVGMLFLRQISLLSFDLLIVAALGVSLYELICAFKEHMTIPAIVMTVLFGLSVYPMYRFAGGMFGVLILAVCAYALLNVVLLFDKKSTLGTTNSFLSMLFYPAALLATVFYVNNYSVSGGLVGILLIVGVSAMTDTFALLFGKLIGGKKLCPSISPNKTVAGAVGGLAGGIAGAVIIWAIFRAETEALFAVLAIPAAAVMIILGILGAIATQLGDLVASSLKRKTGVKDFGNIFPGHGGIVDRLDGIMYNALLIYGFYMLFL